MTNWSLIGDIGGTNARFAVVEEHQITHQAEFSTDAEQTLVEIAEVYINRMPNAPLNSLIAVAGPIKNGSVNLTNANQVLSENDLATLTSAKQAKLVNDFEAAAWSLSTVKEKECQLLISEQKTAFRSQGHRVILGVGTGLGVGCSIDLGEKRFAFSGEGGHRSIAAANAFEMEVFTALRHRWPGTFFDQNKVLLEAEGILSGTGLPLLYQAVCEVMGESTDVCKAKELFAMNRHESKALDKTLEIFSYYLGSVASDLAVTFSANGGVFLTGGVILKNPSLMDENFERGYITTSRYDELRSNLPVYLYSNQSFGLIGACNALSHYFPDR